jgi:ABC-type sulfate/molybdate transport systems ATPase subunit
MKRETRADILLAEGACVYFQGVKAVDDVTLEVPRGRITGLIGPNGAGKSTLFNAVSGFVPLTAGSVTLAGQEISKWTPNRIARHGLVRTFQDTRIFKELSVLENVELGAMNAGRFGEEGRKAAIEALDLHSGTAVASELLVRWPQDLTSCCWMSQQPAWMTMKRASLPKISLRFVANLIVESCSSNTTCPSSSVSANGFRS